MVQILTVEEEAGSYFVYPGDDRVRLRTLNDGPLPLLPGWAPSIAMSGVGDACVLELRHVDGNASIWFMDGEFRYVTNSLGDLGEDARGALIEGLAEAAGTAWQQIVCAPSPDLGDGARQVFRSAGHLIRALAGPLCERIMPPAVVPVRLELAEEHELIRSVGAAPAGPELQPPIIQGMFDRDCLRDLIAAARNGHLNLPSPVDGAPLTTDAALCLNNDTMAYKFVDARNGIVFYAIVALWRIALHGLYFPESGLLVCRTRRTHKELGDFLGGTAETVILRHVIAHAALLEEYLTAPSRRVALLYIQEHLGHHLYNELGGLDSVVRAIPRERMPDILLINAPKSEMYGRIDEIFPEIEGRVDRTPRNPEGLARHAYETRCCLVRPTDDYVSRDLANRIIRVAERDPGLDEHRRAYDGLIERGFTIAMLGLRVENRTLVDPVGFFIEAIDTMAERLGRLAVVVDGHDTSTTEDGVRAFQSHGEHIASRSVAEVETEILDAIRLRYHGREDVEIISTVGATMSATLFWCVRSALFVCPWGAGLAKYRWVCNRPGLVVAGDRFLRHGEFLTIHLYDAREFMERPTRIVFFSPDDVEDDPDAPLLIGLADAYRINYRVRPGAVRARVLELLASLQASGIEG